jgi:hypothetical protein
MPEGAAEAEKQSLSGFFPSCAKGYLVVENERLVLSAKGKRAMMMMQTMSEKQRMDRHGEPIAKPDDRDTMPKKRGMLFKETNHEEPGRVFVPAIRSIAAQKRREEVYEAVANEAYFSGNAFFKKGPTQGQKPREEARFLLFA